MFVLVLAGAGSNQVPASRLFDCYFDSVLGYNLNEFPVVFIKSLGIECYPSALAEKSVFDTLLCMLDISKESAEVNHCSVRWVVILVYHCAKCIRRANEILTLVLAKLVGIVADWVLKINL